MYHDVTQTVKTEHTGKYLFLTEQCSGLGLCPGVVGSRSTTVSADCVFTVQVSLLNHMKAFLCYLVALDGS